MMLYIITSIIFFIAILCLILFREKINYGFLNNLYDKLKVFTNKYYKVIVFILFIFTAFTSVFKLGEVPYGLHVDEAGMAYDAISILKYNVDRYLNKFPIYLINYGGRSECNVRISYSIIN